MKQVKTIGETIKSYSSTVTAIFSASVVLFGVFKFVDQGNSNAKEIISIKEQMTEIKNNISDKQSDSTILALNGIDIKLIKIDSKVNRLVNQFIIHSSKDKGVSKEELVQIINDLNRPKAVMQDTMDVQIKIRKLK